MITISMFRHIHFIRTSGKHTSPQSNSYMINYVDVVKLAYEVNWKETDDSKREITYSKTPQHA